MPRWTDRALSLTLALLVTPGLTAAQDLGIGAPMSASDWLSGAGPARPPSTAWRPGDPLPPDASRRRPAAPPARPTSAPPRPVATTAAVPSVGVTRLSDGNPDSKGAIAAGAAHLPADLWGPAPADRLAEVISATQPRLAATRSLFQRMLTAQLAPPGGGAQGDEGRLFLARVDRLIALGRVPDAEALLLSAGTGDARRFARSFDVALLRGDAMAVCQTIADRPGLAPGLAARVYCLAQAGDWPAAALTLHGARDGALIPPQTVALLERFLDDSTADLTTPLPDPQTVTPLEFRLFEAIGQPLATPELPLAFAWADLAGNPGWKARIEAAERLARAAALDDLAVLGDSYLDRQPAASGGPWDRAAAYQRIDAALAAGDLTALSAELPRALPLFAQAGLTGALARLVATRLPGAGLDGPAAEIAAHLRLLAGVPVTETDGLSEATVALVVLAQAGPAGPLPPGSPAAAYERALAATAVAEPPPGGRGMELLAAMADVDAGLDGDTARAAAGLRRMVELGQPDDARRAAVELLLADQMGGRGR